MLWARCGWLLCIRCRRRVRYVLLLIDKSSDGGRFAQVEVIDGNVLQPCRYRPRELVEAKVPACGAERVPVRSERAEAPGMPPPYVSPPRSLCPPAYSAAMPVHHPHPSPPYFLKLKCEPRTGFYRPLIPTLTSSSKAASMVDWPAPQTAYHYILSASGFRWFLPSR